MTGALALLAAGLVLGCPAGVDGRACAELDACIERVTNAPDPKWAPGVTEREKTLVRAALHFEACALVGWSRAVTSSAAVAMLVPAPVVVTTPCPACVCPEPSCVFSVASLVTGAITGAAACGGCAYAASQMCGGLP